MPLGDGMHIHIHTIFNQYTAVRIIQVTFYWLQSRGCILFSMLNSGCSWSCFYWLLSEYAQLQILVFLCKFCNKDVPNCVWLILVFMLRRMFCMVPCGIAAVLCPSNWLQIFLWHKWQLLHFKSTKTCKPRGGTGEAACSLHEAYSQHT